MCSLAKNLPMNVIEILTIYPAVIFKILHKSKERPLIWILLCAFEIAANGTNVKINVTSLGWFVWTVGLSGQTGRVLLMDCHVLQTLPNSHTWTWLEYVVKLATLDPYRTQC